MQQLHDIASGPADTEPRAMNITINCDRKTNFHEGARMRCQALYSAGRFESQTKEVHRQGSTSCEHECSESRVLVQYVSLRLVVILVTDGG